MFVYSHPDPVALSLGVVAALIASAMVFSLLIKPKTKKAKMDWLSS